jgi:hypothetical protein
MNAKSHCTIGVCIVIWLAALIWQIAHETHPRPCIVLPNRAEARQLHFAISLSIYIKHVDHALLECFAPHLTILAVNCPSPAPATFFEHFPCTAPFVTEIVSEAPATTFLFVLWAAANSNLLERPSVGQHNWWLKR